MRECREREREQKGMRQVKVKVLAPKGLSSGRRWQRRRSKCGRRWWVRMEVSVDSGDLEVCEKGKWKG